MALELSSSCQAKKHYQTSMVCSFRIIRPLMSGLLPGFQSPGDWAPELPLTLLVLFLARTFSEEVLLGIWDTYPTWVQMFAPSCLSSAALSVLLRFSLPLKLPALWNRCSATGVPGPQALVWKQMSSQQRGQHEWRACSMLSFDRCISFLFSVIPSARYRLQLPFSVLLLVTWTAPLLFSCLCSLFWPFSYGNALAIPLCPIPCSCAGGTPGLTHCQWLGHLPWDTCAFVSQKRAMTFLLLSHGK